MFDFKNTESTGRSGAFYGYIWRANEIEGFSLSYQNEKGKTMILEGPAIFETLVHAQAGTLMLSGVEEKSGREYRSVEFMEAFELLAVLWQNFPEECKSKRIRLYPECNLCI